MSEHVSSTNRDDFPIVMSAKDLQRIFPSRGTVYRLMSREDIPVIEIGRRKYVNRDAFFDWLDSNTRGGTEKRQTAHEVWKQPHNPQFRIATQIREGGMVRIVGLHGITATVKYIDYIYFEKISNYNKNTKNP